MREKRKWNTVWEWTKKELEASLLSGTWWPFRLQLQTVADEREIDFLTGVWVDWFEISDRLQPYHHFGYLTLTTSLCPFFFLIIFSKFYFRLIFSVSMLLRNQQPSSLLQSHARDILFFFFFHLCNFFFFFFFILKRSNF